ncbi:hypothetical protein BN1195_02555 [Chryseobacterium oranimense G311]|nr:hypothetical protein BN1195_02555 [Chryseobacterium oranimense G311]
MDSFKVHLNKFIKITDEEFASIFSFFKEVEVKKKQNLMLHGEICKSMYFVSVAVSGSFLLMKKERSRPLNLP